MSCGGTREACASLRDRQKLLDPEQLLRAQVPYLKWPARAAETGAGFINIQHGFSMFFPYFPMKYRGFLWFPVNVPFQSSEPTQNHHEKAGLAPGDASRAPRAKGGHKSRTFGGWTLMIPGFGCQLTDAEKLPLDVSWCFGGAVPLLVFLYDYARETAFLRRTHEMLKIMHQIMERYLVDELFLAQTSK